MNKGSIRFHKKREEWIQTTIERCQKHGDTIEVERDGMSFYIKVSCPHQEELDDITKSP
jgi:hypothetical protein